MGAVMLAWITEVGLITWRDLTGKAANHTVGGFPIPADYIATFIVFGTLGMVPKDNAGAARAAALAAWAYVIATYMNALPNTLNPSGTPKATSASAAKTTPTSTAPSTTVGG
jgi:hypothetical protein